MDTSAKPKVSTEDFDNVIWQELYPFLFPPKSFQRASAEVSAILKKTGLKKGRVLDLACGPGRHSIPLAGNGFYVTGVDRSSFLLSKARDYALRERVGFELINKDMRLFSRPDHYDLALSMHSSFGYFEDPMDNRAVLKRVYGSLKRGGMFFIDLPGREVLIRNFRHTVRKKVSGFGNVTEYRTILDGGKKLRLNWRYYQEGLLKNYSFKLWLYSGPEIRNVLAETGFEDISLFGNFSLSPYDQKAKQLIAFAVKK
jgi:SAM-dependent methyltransferase